MPVEAVSAAKLDFAYRYPFSIDAKEVVESLGMKRVEQKFVDAAKQRVEEALKDAHIGFTPTSYPDLQLTYLVSYAYARMLVSAFESAYLVSRYAIAESKRTGEALISDSNESITRVAKGLGLDIAIEGNECRVACWQYLNCAPKSVDYALIHQRLDGGTITLTKSKMIRVIEEASKASILQGMPIDKKILPKEVVSAARTIKVNVELGETKMVNVKESEYPPCIRKILFDLKKGVNLPHQARWVMAVYLLNVGVTPDEIKKLFITAPDYSEHVTSYQVDFLAKNNYKMLTCATMRGYALCIADCRCGTPLKYGKRGKTFNFNPDDGMVMEAKKS